MSEAPASILITCAESERGQTSSPKARGKATAIKTNDDLAWGNISKNHAQKCLGNGPYFVLYPKMFKTHHHFGWSARGLPGDFHLALAVGKDWKAVGRCCSFGRGHINGQHPPECWAGVFHAHDHLLPLGTVFRRLYQQFALADALLGQQINRMRQKHVETQ